METKPPLFTPYKFRELKVYSSKEWLADDKKKYRMVFDTSETTYIYAELSLFNKLFDEDDWTVDIQLHAYAQDGKQLCEIKTTKAVSRDENIVYIREGWGNNEPGSFWKKGTYRWEAYINGERLASQPFYIVDGGTFEKPADNPYFEIQHLRLYEGDYTNIPETERTYLRAFSRETVRYVWAEFEARKRYDTPDYWPCELRFNYKSQSGLLKGSIQELVMVAPENDLIRCTVGWGSSTVGTWFDGPYYLELVFMDRRLAWVPFEIGATNVSADGASYFLPDGSLQAVKTTQQITQELQDKTLEALDKLIGLQEIKNKAREYISYLKFLKIRSEKGIEEPGRLVLHSVFMGNPGTGKTTVATLLGKAFCQLGLLARGHVHEVDRSDLIGEFIGQTAPKVKEALKQAEGGVLFIDEAYALARKGEDTKDFGREVIEILIKEMSDNQHNLAIFVAGYPEEMEYFLKSNPGLKSRFKYFYHFSDYSPDELMAIAEQAAQNRKIRLDPAAQAYLYEELVKHYRTRDQSFGNARFVHATIDAAKMNMGLRLMKLSDPTTLTEEELSTLLKDDLQQVFYKNKAENIRLPIDEELLKIALRELHALVGLREIKKEIDELVQLVRFYREIGKDIRDEFYLHSTFVGNPGTGKTTVARILSDIFKALCIIERGHLVEADRTALVASYQGQTAEKTTKLVNSALGGVLFIDEAYTLNMGPQDTFGHEAIATLLKRMEDQRGQFICIAAGYTSNMEVFLESNPGLKSRFELTFRFNDYNAEELNQIALNLLAREDLEATPEAAEQLRHFFRSLDRHRDKHFGNAREVRRVIERAIRNHHLRLSQIPMSHRTPEQIRTLTLQDVSEFNASNLSVRKSAVGFQLAQASA
jgi:SpoVK/Ycf46/Vps4 family AAA+-type ATPase